MNEVARRGDRAGARMEVRVSDVRGVRDGTNAKDCIVGIGFVRCGKGDRTKEEEEGDGI